MGADTTPVDSVEAPPLKPISIPSRLADTPSQDPKYSLTVHDSGGQSVTLADPNATRAAVALMT